MWTLASFRNKILHSDLEIMLDHYRTCELWNSRASHYRKYILRKCHAELCGENANDEEYAYLSDEFPRSAGTWCYRLYRY